MIAANNPNKKSWIEVDSLSEFPIQNIPFSIMKTSNGFAACTRIGNLVINLDVLNKNVDYISDKLNININDRPQNLSPQKYFELCKEYEKLIF